MSPGQQADIHAPPALTLRHLHPEVGTEIVELDVRDDPVAVAEQVRRVLVERHLVVLRRQDLRPADLVAFARGFGEVEAFPGLGDPECPEALAISNRADKGNQASPYWHADGMLQPDPPSLTFFYAIEVPEEGGDTLFQNAHTAFNALPAEDQRTLAPLRSVQPNRVEHPIVRNHPVTGRKALYLDLALTVGVTGLARADAVELFRRLRDHYECRERVYRHKFRKGDLLIWDNASIAHSATKAPAHGETRLMLRMTVRGGPTF
jgi:taurine dioxygenase